MQKSTILYHYLTLTKSASNCFANDSERIMCIDWIGGLSQPSIKNGVYRIYFKLLVFGPSTKIAECRVFFHLRADHGIQRFSPIC